MKNKYDLFGKRIAVLDTRIERMNSAVVADNLILQKGTLFFHYLNNQWGWFMNSNGDKFEGKYFGEIVGLKPHGKGTNTYPNGFKSGDGKVELVGEWKEGEPWNITRYNKSGEITAKWVNGVMTDKGSVVMEKSQQGILLVPVLLGTLFVWYVKCDYRNIIESSCVKINSSRSSYINVNRTITILTAVPMHVISTSAFMR